MTRHDALRQINKEYKFTSQIAEDPSSWVLYPGFLWIFFVLKFIFTGLSLSCPVPGGIFTPIFATGAAFGQIYAGILQRALFFFGIPSNYLKYRGIYSLLGAAGLTASVTRTVSVAMIAIELNGHLSHAVPIMATVITSYIVSEYLKPMSYFEMLST